MKLPNLKWWQWALVAVVGLAVIGQLFGGGNGSDEKVNSSASQQQTAKPNQSAETKSEPKKDDGCITENAEAYADFWAAKDSSPVRLDFSGTFPNLLISKRDWLAMGPEGQLGVVAIVDCGVAGPGKHIAKITISEGLGMEPYATFESTQLLDARKVAKPLLARKPKD